MEAFERHMEHALAAVRRRDYAMAYQHYTAALRERPDSVEALMAFGRATYWEYVDLEAAATLFGRARARAPDALEPLLWAAEVYSMGYGEGYKAAADLYRRAIQLYPTDVDAYIGLGMCLHSPGDPVSLPEAVQAYRTALQLDPQRLDALYNLGNVLIEAGERAQARETFVQAQQVLVRTGAHAERDIHRIQELIDRLDRHEDFTSHVYTHGSMRFRWPDA